jgi:hypothetical protein
MTGGRDTCVAETLHQLGARESARDPEVADEAKG